MNEDSGFVNVSSFILACNEPSMDLQAISFESGTLVNAARECAASVCCEIMGCRIWWTADGRAAARKDI